VFATLVSIAEEPALPIAAEEESQPRPSFPETKHARVNVVSDQLAGLDLVLNRLLDTCPNLSTLSATAINRSPQAIRDFHDTMFPRLAKKTSAALSVEVKFTYRDVPVEVGGGGGIGRRQGIVISLSDPSGPAPRSRRAVPRRGEAQER